MEVFAGMKSTLKGCTRSLSIILSLLTWFRDSLPPKATFGLSRNSTSVCSSPSSLPVGCLFVLSVVFRLVAFSMRPQKSVSHNSHRDGYAVILSRGRV